METQEVVASITGLVGRGLGVAVGLRFAGSADRRALAVLVEYAALLDSGGAGVAEAGRATIECCLSAVVLAMGPFLSVPEHLGGEGAEAAAPNGSCRRKLRRKRGI